MRCIKKLRPAMAGLFVLLCGCLTGCSVSFCGFRGKGEEFAFVCQEETDGTGPAVKQKSAVQQNDMPEVSEQAADTQTEPSVQEAETALETVQEAETAPETVQEAVATPEVVPEDGRININTAGVEELTTLKGVGESRANAIIAFREEHGSFENPEDIMQIAGIKEGIYAKIKDQIKVR